MQDYLLDEFWSGGHRLSHWKRFSSKLIPNRLLQKLYFSTFYATYILQFSKREMHIHDISNTYVSFPQLFAKGKSLKSVGIGMPRDKNKGIHGNCLIGPQLGHAEPIKLKIAANLLYNPQRSRPALRCVAGHWRYSNYANKRSLTD
jgi:hypothetical protein